MRKLRFLAGVFEKKCRNCQLYMTVNNSKVALILKILRTASHPCLNYGLSNLLFCFSYFCRGHLNKMQTEIAVRLTLPVLECYTKMKIINYINCKLIIQINHKLYKLQINYTNQSTIL